MYAFNFHPLDTVYVLLTCVLQLLILTRERHPQAGSMFGCYGRTTTYAWQFFVVYTRYLPGTKTVCYLARTDDPRPPALQCLRMLRPFFFVVCGRECARSSARRTTATAAVTRPPLWRWTRPFPSKSATPCTTTATCKLFPCPPACPTATASLLVCHTYVSLSSTTATAVRQYCHLQTTRYTRMRIHVYIPGMFIHLFLIYPSSCSLVFSGTLYKTRYL